MRQDPRFPNLFIVDHPLVQHKLSHMRDIETSTKTFRQLLKELTLLMGYELTRDLPMSSKRIETPLTAMDAPVIGGKKVAVVPVLRAGLGMAEGIMELIPSARQGHIGLYRGEDKRPVEYYVRLPEIEGRMFIICDPMLATGFSGAYAVQVLLDRGVKAENIRFLSLVAAPEGVQAFHLQHPKVAVYTAALDTHLDENAYIVPGLGDAGDRIFGTKH
jgi:uracil phosphoribosyltransferase